MPDSLHAVIWDLDGVIIDSAEEHRQAWQRLAQEEGIQLSDAVFWATFGKRNDDIIPVIWGPQPPERRIATRGQRRLGFVLRLSFRTPNSGLPLFVALLVHGCPQAPQPGQRSALAGGTSTRLSLGAP